MVLALSSGSSPLLLIGDQGTGKNKITDRLLQLMKLEREYMQLHRDSTVQSLTVVPTLTEGALEWVDSPLVSAIKHGRVIVIDEAGKDVLDTTSTGSPHANNTPLVAFFSDKAPTETVVVLKGLVEDGLMQLSDGRQIMRKDRFDASDPNSNNIMVHPDFRMIVLICE